MRYFKIPVFIRLPNIHIEGQNKILVMGRHVNTVGRRSSTVTPDP